MDLISQYKNAFARSHIATRLNNSTNYTNAHRDIIRIEKEAKEAGIILPRLVWSQEKYDYVWEDGA